MLMNLIVSLYISNANIMLIPANIDCAFYSILTFSLIFARKKTILILPLLHRKTPCCIKPRPPWQVSKILGCAKTKIAAPKTAQCQFDYSIPNY